MTQVYLLKLDDRTYQNFMSLDEAKRGGVELFCKIEKNPNGWSFEYSLLQGVWALSLVAPDTIEFRFTSIMIRQVILEDL